jgi:anti-sigma B factor antagonist
MELYHEIRPDAFVLILTGSIDDADARELDLAFHKALHSRRNQILVDCHKLSFISAAGIGVFLAHLPHLREKGVQLAFAGLPAKIREAFQVYGLDNLAQLSGASLPNPAFSR